MPPDIDKVAPTGDGAPDSDNNTRPETMQAEREALKTVLKDTIINIEGLIEEAERVLRRAKAGLASIDKGED